MFPVQEDGATILVTKHAVNVPHGTIQSLCREFNIQHNEVDNFVMLLIEKAVADRISETNSKIFSDSEVKEMEDDLKGLGYI
jgi:hypothetical protein